MGKGVGAMVEFIQMIFGGGAELAADEFRRLRDSLILAIVVALLFILPGAFMGAWGFIVKVIWLEIGMVIAAVNLLYLAYYRIPGGTAVGTTLELAFAEPAGRGIVRTPVQGFLRYVRFIAAFLASELTVALIVVWVPAHKNPAMALLAIPVAIAIIGHIIWKGGGEWWAKVVHGLPYATLFLALLAILFPDAADAVATLWDGFNIALWEMLWGRASLQTVVMTSAVLILASITGAALVEHPKAKGLVLLVVPIVLLLDLRWFFWGDGARYWQTPSRPATTSVATPTPAPPSAKTSWPVEVFRGNRGEERSTVLVDVGWRYTVHSNHPWVALTTGPDGKQKTYNMPEGVTGLMGTNPREILKVRFLKDGTEIRFERTS